MRKTFIASLIATAFLVTNTQAADLLQIYQEALSNDAQYASARDSLAIGQERTPQARAGLLPTVGLGGSSTQSSSDVAPSIGTSHNSGYTLSLSQPLFRWANWEQYEQGKLATALSEIQFSQAKQDLIIRVAQAYFDVLFARDTLAAVQAQKVATTEQLASAKRNFEVGTQTITDTHEAQARYDLIVAQEFAAQNDLDIKRAALQEIIGKPPSPLATLKAGVQLSMPSPATIEPWVTAAEQKNYSVVGSQIVLESARRDISRNRAGHYPTLDLVASRGYNNSNSGIQIGNTAGRSNTNVIGVQWNIPIFSGFAVSSKVKEAIAVEDKSRNDLETAKRTAAQAARASYFGVNNGLAQVKALEAAEISNQSSLDSNKLGYQVGVRINIDVLNAQQQLFTTRSQLAKARYDTIMNGLHLKYAAGSLKEEDLAAVNTLLDPAVVTSYSIDTDVPAVALRPQAATSLRRDMPVSRIESPQQIKLLISYTLTLQPGVSSFEALAQADTEKSFSK